MMDDKRLSIYEHVTALDHLERLGFELNRAASWLSERDFESEADLLNDAAKDTMAVVGLLSRPLRPQPPPSGWQQTG